MPAVRSLRRGLGRTRNCLARRRTSYSSSHFPCPRPSCLDDRRRGTQLRWRLAVHLKGRAGQKHCLVSDILHHRAMHMAMTQIQPQRGPLRRLGRRRSGCSARQEKVNPAQSTYSTGR